MVTSMLSTLIFTVATAAASAVISSTTCGRPRRLVLDDVTADPVLVVWMVAVFVCCASEPGEDVLSAVLVAVSQVSAAPDSAALDSTMMCSSSNPAVT